MFRRAAALLVAVGCCALACAHDSAGTPVAPSATAHPSVASARGAQARPVSDALIRRRVLLGRSVRRRPIVGYQIGDPDSSRRLLIVGCIHGDEPGGIDVVKLLSRMQLPAEADMWLLPNLNPDGVAATTRVNAHGVDLNRNFPYRWRPLGAVGSLHYAGPHPLSEPEARVAASFVRRIRPTLAVWYHQALDVVDISQGPLSAERSYATAARLPLQKLPDYPGSAVGYENHIVGPTAFVVELPGTVTTSVAMANARAVMHIATIADGSG